ncbi:hypothetical protein CLOSTHATH_06402 [Hungatella hathewayi DSM 13479]|uniref:Uncharacterized protein n=1 Tax=Hungatella hathewayi DSM 13479 TaxID=566550 RepID=D3ARZ6_9FIRM|nr:hypothetical protein CLOSTHATH_06402 [Hungatella hathewayi DSM 13479]
MDLNPSSYGIFLLYDEGFVAFIKIIQNIYMPYLRIFIYFT